MANIKITNLTSFPVGFLRINGGGEVNIPPNTEMPIDKAFKYMTGLLSEEFQAITDIGEDTLVFCNNCDYSTNLEISSFKIEKSEENHGK